MKTIIAAVDFSENSVNAANYAADMACATGYDLMLVNVCADTIPVAEAPAAFYTLEKLFEDAEKEMDALRDAVVTRTLGKIKVTGIVKRGDIIEGLRQCCLDNNTYALVMGREDMGALERLVLGSRTVSAVQHLSCPMIAVPPDAKFTGIRNIGLACDFRDVIETLPVPEIKNLVKETKAALHVLHVSDETGDEFDATTIEESGWFQDMVGDLKPQYHFIKGKDADAGVMDFADKNHLDLLIVIPKKHGLLGRLLKHSHSKSLVLHAHVPVMALHS